VTRYRVRWLDGQWIVMQQRFDEVWWTHRVGFNRWQAAMHQVDLLLRMDEVRARNLLWGVS
jgi:hypothetical protein